MFVGWEFPGFRRGRSSWYNVVTGAARHRPATQLQSYVQFAAIQVRSAVTMSHLMKPERDMAVVSLEHASEDDDDCRSKHGEADDLQALPDRLCIGNGYWRRLGG